MRDDWLNPGIDALLIKLHALTGDAQLSMRQISDVINAEFGTQLSRNAIIGRSHRLKLAKRPSPLPPKPVKREIVKMPEQPPVPIEPIVPSEPEHRNSEPEIIAPQPLRHGISIYELERHSCRFILNDVESRPPFDYCGKRVLQNGGPWCKSHYERVYSKGRW